VVERGQQGGRRRATPLRVGQLVHLGGHDGPPAQQADPHLDAGLGRLLGRVGRRWQRGRRERGSHAAEPVGQQVRLRRAVAGPHLHQPGDVRPDPFERRHDAGLALAPRAAEPPPQVPGHHTHDRP